MPNQLTEQIIIERTKNTYSGRHSFVKNLHSNRSGYGRFNCNIHNEEFDVKYTEYFRKGSCGCKKCSLALKTKSKEHYQEKLDKKVNRHIIQDLFEEKIQKKNSNRNTIYKAKILCVVHNVTYTQERSNIGNSVGCKNCSNNFNQLSNETIIERTKNTYPGRHSFVESLHSIRKGYGRFNCNIHNEKFDVNYDCYFSKNSYGCKKCSASLKRIKRTKSKEHYQEKLDKKVSKHLIQDLFEEEKQKKNSNRSSIYKAKILCVVHNVTYNQTRSMIGLSVGCKDCNSGTRVKTSNKENLEIINLLETYHFKYEYQNKKRKIDIKKESEFEIRCATHHESFWITKKALKRKVLKCSKCVLHRQNDRKKNKPDGYKLFKEQGNKLYNGQFIYPFKTIAEFPFKTKSSKLHMKCSKCQFEFQNSFLEHINQKRGCLKCREKSKGETQIQNILDVMNISYIPFKIFDNCKDSNHLIFDFFLPNHNLIIEYDGQQHYVINNHFHQNDIEKFLLALNRDRIKNDYAVKNKISLLRISYLEDKKIEAIIIKAIHDTSKGNYIHKTILFNSK